MSKARILVVDDEPMNVDLLSRYLVRAGYDVISAFGGADALDLAIEDTPDLVLLDWMMPEISGIDVLRSLREHYSANEMPVIMCTALDEADHVVAALSEGANDFVSKPINQVILRARVTAQLERRAGAKAMSDLNSRLEALVAERTRALSSIHATSSAALDLSPEECITVQHILDAVAQGQFDRLQEFRHQASAIRSRAAASNTAGNNAPETRVVKEVKFGG